MSSHFFLAAAALLVALVLQAGETASKPTVLPDGGRALLTQEPTFSGEPAKFSCQNVAVEGMPFNKAFRITIRQPGNAWDAQLIAPIPSALANGQTCLLRVWLRAVSTRAESGEAVISAHIQKAGPNWEKPFSSSLSAHTQWKEWLQPFAMDRDFAANGAQLVFHVADRVQEFEVGGIELLSYGKDRKPSELPRTSITYAGMEPDSPWRAEAEKRIEQHRKGDLTVRVLDADGKPLAGAQVRVRMTRHAFPFGTAAVAGRIMGTKPEDETYRQQLTRLFNAVVLENDLKWGAFIGEWGPGFKREQTLAALKWLKERKFFTRGHVMVWPSWRNLPNKIKPLQNDLPALRKAILDRIDDAANATAGLTDQWDVLNEPFDNHDVMDRCGREVMVEWFQRAREKLPPECHPFINDYGIVAAGGATDTPHQKHYEETIRFLLEQKAPVEGIGVQSHFGNQPTPPVVALKILDRFGTFKRPIMVTEFDIATQDEPYQANYTRDYLTVCFSHPSVAGFLMWGFWEGAHWIPSGSMLRRDWSGKPNLAVWEELVLKKWWTDATVVTGADGQASVRGFKGEYAVTVSVNGREGKTTATIGDTPAKADAKF